MDDYIASQPDAVRRVLKRVRRSIRKAVPADGEVISYKIPTYKFLGSRLFYFAGFTHTASESICSIVRPSHRFSCTGCPYSHGYTGVY